MNRPFTGSFRADQTTFLLAPLTLANTGVEEKERLIQSGQRHYSEMLTWEKAPAPEYRELFLTLTARYRSRLASEIKALAAALAASYAGELTLVSLARAGTPIGALLQRALELEGRAARHYSVSIILGRGIDTAALHHLVEIERRDPASIRFIDGWTAKGTVGRELRASLARWNGSRGATMGELSAALHVVMDLGGTADLAATLDDYAIPCGILNATVSGLVSRTVLLPDHDPAALHGCVYYRELEAADQTQWFFEEIASELLRVTPAVMPTAAAVAVRRRETEDFLREVCQHYAVTNLNRIKPGVAEATRAVLRRHPERVVVRDPDQLDTAHLMLLSKERNLPIEVHRGMPFNAFTLIRRTDG